MGKAFLYDVYDNRKKVLDSAKLSEVRAFLDSPNLKVADYLDGSMYHKRYSITVAGEYASVKTSKLNIPSGFCNDWNRVCRRYRGYRWVKEPGPGVYKLVPGNEGGRNVLV